jgi:hypothetical protein
VIKKMNVAPGLEEVGTPILRYQHYNTGQEVAACSRRLEKRSVTVYLQLTILLLSINDVSNLSVMHGHSSLKTEM